jgi:hypothetical protein
MWPTSLPSIISMFHNRIGVSTIDIQGKDLYMELTQDASIPETKMESND